MSTRLRLSCLFVVGLLFVVLAVHVYGGCFLPTVTSVTPNTGPTTGGTAVTIKGTNFVAPATVSFGGEPATGVVVVNLTTITAVTPSNSPGPVDVVVTTVCGSGTLPGGFTYVAAAIPTLSPLVLAALAAILALVGVLIIKR